MTVDIRLWTGAESKRIKVGSPPSIIDPCRLAEEPSAELPALLVSCKAGMMAAATTGEIGARTDPLVSVILPVYNAERTVAQSLASVTAQTHARLDIIVIDDGSTDQTAAILGDCAARDPRIRVLTIANGGVAHARNIGIAQARGEYIAPIDADDLWAATKIERQLEEFARGGDEIALVYCGFSVIDSSNRLFWDGPRRFFAGEALPALLREDFIGNGSNALIRRADAQAVGGYDESLRAHGAQGTEDWSIALDIARRGRIAVVPEPLLGYRRTRGNMSSRSIEMLRSARLVAARVGARDAACKPLLAAHMRDRERWIYARAISELNIRELRLLIADPAIRSRLAELTISGLRVAVSNWLHALTSSLRLRRPTYFRIS